MQVALWCLGGYLLIGVCITIYLYEPEQDGWLWQILLWPLTLAALLFAN